MFADNRAVLTAWFFLVLFSLSGCGGGGGGSSAPLPNLAYRFGKPTSFFYTFFSTLMVGLFALPIPHYLPNGNEGRHV